MGNFHGGAIATLADVLSSIAIMTVDPRPSVSVNLSVNYLVGAKKGTEVT